MTGVLSHLDDLHGAVKDMMKRKRKRQLGFREHKRIYRDARKGAIAAIAHSMPPDTPAG